MPRTRLSALLCFFLIAIASTTTTMASPTSTSGPFPPPSAVNAPPAAATLVLLATSARLDRAADSGSRLRVSIRGAPPAAVSISGGPFQERQGRPPPQLINATAALAALPPKAPAVVVATGADGAQKTLILSLEGPPQVFSQQEQEEGGGNSTSSSSSNSALSIALEGDIVDEGKDVSLNHGAAAALLNAPGRLTRSSVPGRLEFDDRKGVAVYIDVRH